MRRSDHPNRPSAITCCFLSSLKTLLTLTQGNSRVRINVLDQTFVGRFSSDNHWPHLSDYRGHIARYRPESSASSRTQDSEQRVREEDSSSHQTWPEPLKEEAFYGVAGDLVRAIEPHT